MTMTSKPPETEALDAELREEGKKALRDLTKKSKESGFGAPATIGDVFQAVALAHGLAVNCVAEYVKERAVLRDDPPAATSSLEPHWKGVYAKDAVYPRDSWVVHHNAVWVAKEDTGAEPGTSDSGWQLAVKSPERFRPKHRSG